MSVVSFFLRYSNKDFVSGLFFSLRKISVVVKIFVLNGVVNFFVPFHCLCVSGVIDSPWKATLVSHSVDFALLTSKWYNFVIV